MPTFVVQGLDQIWLGIIRINTGWRNGTAVLLVTLVLNVLYSAPQASFFLYNTYKTGLKLPYNWY